MHWTTTPLQLRYFRFKLIIILYVATYQKYVKVRLVFNAVSATWIFRGKYVKYIFAAPVGFAGFDTDPCDRVQ